MRERETSQAAITKLLISPSPPKSVTEAASGHPTPGRALREFSKSKESRDSSTKKTSLSKRDSMKTSRMKSDLSGRLLLIT